MIVRARIFRRRTVRTEKKILVSKLGQIMLGSVFFFTANCPTAKNPTDRVRDDFPR